MFQIYNDVFGAILVILCGFALKLAKKTIRCADIRLCVDWNQVKATYNWPVSGDELFILYESLIDSIYFETWPVGCTGWKQVLQFIFVQYSLDKILLQYVTGEFTFISFWSNYSFDPKTTTCLP